MFRLKTTSYIIVWLILFQSFCAVANSMDYHSIDPQHLSEVHEHTSDKNLSSKVSSQQRFDLPSNIDNATANDNSHNPADCHHCGHCNGTHAQWLEHSAYLQLNSSLTANAFYYLSIVIEAPVTQLLRPPKA